VTRLRGQFPNIFVLYTPEGATADTPDIILRVYLNDNTFRRTTSKTVDPERMAFDFFDTLVSTPLRGLPGIVDARVIEVVRHRVVSREFNAAKAGKVERAEKTFVIKTSGTNLHAAALHARIDKNTAVSSSIGDTIKMFGIEAGRAAMINEIRRVMGGKPPNVRHLQIFADQMTRTGVHTPCESDGITKREPSNIMLSALAHAPLVPFTRAALEGTISEVYGVATPLLLGSVPHVGTGYVQLAFDGEFIASQRQSITEILSEL
jgi:DNA-directed RNA polymerase II subunit RPB1